MVAHEPVLHTLDLLTHRRDGESSAPFLSATADGGAVLQGRMSLIQAGGEATGYVITFDDATRQITALGRRDSLLRELLAQLRKPLDALPDSPERAALATTLARAEADWRGLAAGWWPMADIHSGDLAELVVRRLQDSGIELHAVGLPVWLHGDSHTLVLVLEALIRAAAEGTDGAAFDIEAESRDGGTRLEVMWRGDPLSAADLAGLLDRPLAGALGGMTVRDALMHHSSTLEQGTREGISWLWLPLASGASAEGKAKAKTSDAVVPARPEFFDFDLLGQDRDIGNRGAIPLRSLTYVVFDTETTGLSPSQGDQIVSIAGVRIVNGRILTGESFSRIVNPRRPIPPESVKFHGITDSMVADRPPIGVVLPQFKAFCADAVLVAHNAAFDLKFIRMRERDARVTFDNPVLDTMLLSSWVDGSKDNQSLDAIAERYGIDVTDRHTALGDAMVTAALLLRLIDALEERGLHTLDDAVKTLNMTWELHNRGAVF
ncbi:MAG: 3'-5' exonuclease [Alphaproteobacteria bacterium]|nr:3'-5' exonuclease [Alphaproteobacteria bacterium]